MVDGRLHEAIESLSELRHRLLNVDPENADLRTSFREITYHLESIKQQRPVPFDAFRQLADWLAMFLDADFGARLCRCDQLTDTERNSLSEHIQTRRQLLAQAEREVPPMASVLDECLTALNMDNPPGKTLEKQARLLARALKNHMQDDAKLRKAMHGLVDAMQQSLEEISATLGDMGEDIPELATTQDLLSMELPSDPKAARKLLQQARDNILQAGMKVGRAGKAISQALEHQKSQMQTMSENLNRAEFEAKHDVLTGLGNRRKLADFFKALNNRPAAFLIIDIDHFKKINDRYGHDAGDEILRATAEILTANVRATDLIVRLGGEEFAAVLPDVDPDNAFAIAETLRMSIASSGIKCSKGKVAVTVSIGLASRRADEGLGRWIGRGDEALYEAKNNGRNRTEVSRLNRP